MDLEQEGCGVDGVLVGEPGVVYGVSHGTMNEIYYPYIDRPQTRDMELLFTDGETFFHEEKRDLDYDFHYIDAEDAGGTGDGERAGRTVPGDEGVSERSALSGGADERTD